MCHYKYTSDVSNIINQEQHIPMSIILHAMPSLTKPIVDMITTDSLVC